MIVCLRRLLFFKSPPLAVRDDLSSVSFVSVCLGVLPEQSQSSHDLLVDLLELILTP